MASLDRFFAGLIDPALEQGQVLLEQGQVLLEQGQAVQAVLGQDHVVQEQAVHDILLDCASDNFAFLHNLGNQLGNQLLDKPTIHGRGGFGQGKTLKRKVWDLNPERTDEEKLDYDLLLITLRVPVAGCALPRAKRSMANQLGNQLLQKPTIHGRGGLGRGKTLIC